LKDDYNSSFRAKVVPPQDAKEHDDANDDDEPEPAQKSSKPVAVEALIGHVEYKFLPDRLRQMILAELVYCTDPDTRVFPGCTASMDTNIGRNQAFWLSLCRCVIINHSKVPHSDIVKMIPATEDMDAHVPILKKRDIQQHKCKDELVNEFAIDLGVFGGPEHKAIADAIGIGGKAPFLTPVDMAMENHSDKAKAAKALEMMTLPYRLPEVASALGIKKAGEETTDEDDDGEGHGGGGGNEEEGYPCVMEVGDTLDQKYMKSIKKALAKVRSEHEEAEKEFRAIVVTSPPWGTLDAERSGVGGEDEALSADQIRGVAITLADILDDTGVVCIHLPPLDMGAWRTLFESTGKWHAYMSPIAIMPGNTKGLNFYTKYQMATNVFHFLCFHKSDVHPLVTADFLRDKRAMVKLMNALWNAGTSIPSAAVPKIERVTSKVNAKATYVRTQQLATAVIRPVIRIFGRALHEQASVCVIDPFMGTGSTAVAAHQLGCSFMGWDRDRVVVTLANTKFKQLVQVLL
jgi:predicted RNA methylase